ncbi:universal stress protein [Roseospira marina]|uniref:Universal stress protein n=1 Tax=Roseospira marina TaxID=140057 RepID=A0A5M6IC23_9PROT|nr:universal stress protein [Roseospira marina]KAA5605682.1 universal stress protein [Roseospira marina]MBB4313238.1 nucleotide-binding universal stress UspA family protein [Roseospira marina]MBB5086021.1 nucleotide-binding universal stress UspA family protein [Roseospira marina]
MALKDILVHLDSSQHCRARVEAAASLATRHGARLTGLFVRTTPHVPQFVMSQLGPEVTRAQRRYAEEASAKAKATFEAVLGGFEIASEYRDPEGELLDTLVLHARYADLVILGQYDRRDDNMADEREAADQVIMDSGRPVLVIPYAGQHPRIGDKVLVAWNASREATRAISDALPILQTAREVDVLAINPHHNGVNGHGDIPGADICGHLARHGVKAVAEHVVAHDVDVGNLLLSRASDSGADLIVMGAYGRSRLRELVLGGATWHILHHMTVPILMGH